MSKFLKLLRGCVLCMLVAALLFLVFVIIATNSRGATDAAVIDAVRFVFTPRSVELEGIR